MYTIVGGNQQPYGPVEADLIRAWVAEGRANGNTIAKAEDGAWKPLRTFPEFADLFPGVTIEQARSVLEHAAKSSLATT